MRNAILVLGTSLTVSAAPALAAQQVLTFGVPMRGELTDRSPRREGDRQPYADFLYRHQGGGTDSLVLEVTSNDFDAYLTVTGPEGFSEEDDDGGRGLNPRIITPLEGGEYGLRVTSLDLPGKFQVVIRPLTPEDRAHAQAMAEFALGPRMCEGLGSVPEQSESDVLHPKHFTIVLERPRRPMGGGPTILATVFRPSATDPRRTEEAPETEVDRFSHVSIEWNRPRLREIAQFANIAITVRARVESSSGTRNAEVWSYSTIGQQRRTVGTAIRNLVNLGTAVCGLIKAIDVHKPVIDRYADASQPDSARRYLRLSMPDFTTYLTNLANPDNGPGFKIAAYKRSIDPAVIVDYAQGLLATLRPMREGSTDTGSITLVRDFLTQIDRLGKVIRDLADVIAVEQDRRERGEIAAEQLTAQLKDGDLFVPETGARPGDRIIIEIENDASFDSIPRILKIPIRIVDFGLTQRTRDAFFFVTRIGAGPGRSAEAIADSLDPVTASGVTTSVSEPLSVNFAPTPGITYGWSYYPRNVLGSRDLTGIVRWLHPGFGINVSFPRFGDRVVRFTQSDPATTSPAQVQVEESTAPINVAAGLVASVFDGAVQFTYGWNLSVDERRRYWGVGFSFIKLAGAIAGGVTE